MYQILLIDDAKADNFLHARTLRKRFADCTVHTADDGEQGLAMLTAPTSPPFDLILLDVNMPVLDAWGFLDRYAGLADESRAKCLLLMVSVGLPAKDRARVADCCDIVGTVVKPLDADAVAEFMIGVTVGR